MLRTEAVWSEGDRRAPSSWQANLDFDNFRADMSLWWGPLWFIRLWLHLFSRVCFCYCPAIPGGCISYSWGPQCPITLLWSIKCRGETETFVIFISNCTNVLLFLKDTSQICPSADHRDWLCPVCLQTASFPVQTNCGHLFCGKTVPRTTTTCTWSDLSKGQ